MARTIERKTCLAPDGVTLVYSAAGSGEPALVFVHGGLADRSFWEGELKNLSGNHRAIALDLAGHGESGSNRRNGGSLSSAPTCTRLSTPSASAR